MHKSSLIFKKGCVVSLAIGATLVALLWLTVLVSPTIGGWQFAIRPAAGFFVVGPAGGWRISSIHGSNRWELYVTDDELGFVHSMPSKVGEGTKDFDWMVGEFGFAAQRLGASKVRILVLPPWLAVALLALWPGYRALREVIRRSRLESNPLGCIRCGYDLTGNVTGKCPECGEAIQFGSMAECHSVSHRSHHYV